MKFFCLFLCFTAFSTAFPAQAPDGAFAPLAPHPRRFCINDFGATSGGAGKCTAAFARAVSAAASAGGGEVVVPPGEWLTGAIELKSGVTLRVEKGATVVFTDDIADYPEITTPHEGREIAWPCPLIGAKGAERIAVTGGGTLACRTEKWWPKDFWKGDRRKAERRPHFMTFDRCRDVTLDGFTIRESPCWTIHLYCSTNVTVRNLDVAAHGPNSDGIDIESSCDVLLENCRFEQEDDVICFKSGRDEEGRARNIPTERVTVRNCTAHSGHALFALGSELSGGLRDIVLEDCRVDGGVERLFRIKTNPLRGGYIRNVRARRIRAKDVSDAVVSVRNDYYCISGVGMYCWTPELGIGRQLCETEISDVSVEDVAVESAGRRHEIRWIGEKPLSGLRTENVCVDSVHAPDLLEGCHDDF